MEHQKIARKLYLVLDPAKEKTVLLNKLDQALQGGVNMLQIWNNWPAAFKLADKKSLIRAIAEVSSGYKVPLMINEAWELLHEPEISGVHFDSIPGNYKAIKSAVGKGFICGITCGNDLDVVEWAEDNQLDYISFCAMFPSGSVDSCEIVRPETIKKARNITNIPLYASGGITTKNLNDLMHYDLTGIAVISGILDAEKPQDSALAYTNALKNLKT